MESTDDQALALREVARMTGDDPRPASECNFAPELRRRLFEDQDASLAFVVDGSAADAELIRARSAFCSRVDLVDDEIRSTSFPQSAVLELAVSPKPKAANFQPNIGSRRKNSYLSHNIHKYKAKFFPRLARSLINIVSPHDEGVILDPFCGSGTLNAEARLMGIESVGCDIDPLSVEISKAKVDFETLTNPTLPDFLSKSIDFGLSLGLKAPEQNSSYRIPTFLTIRNPKRLTPEIQTETESQVAQIQEYMEAAPNKDFRRVIGIALSHAISTKLSLRWMGTGDDRFALEVAKRQLSQIFVSHLKALKSRAEEVGAYQSAGILSLGKPARIFQSDARELPLEDSSISGIVTSPPYLPASSGRETYLRSRAASITALGLMTENEVHQTEKRMLGSILANAAADVTQLPASVVDLANWMQPQRERKAKSAPTLAYFQSLSSVLQELKRVMIPGSRAAFVLSKEHMFYEYKTKDVLRRFQMADAFAELVESSRCGVGMKVVETHNLELPKMDFVARPGAKHQYSEAVIVFQK